MFLLGSLQARQHSMQSMLEISGVELGNLLAYWRDIYSKSLVYCCEITLQSYKQTRLAILTWVLAHQIRNWHNQGQLLLYLQHCQIPHSSLVGT